jgi:hypothetical protein
MRGLNMPVAHETIVAPSLIVGDNEDHVGLCFGPGLGVSVGEERAQSEGEDEKRGFHNDEL